MAFTQLGREYIVSGLEKIATYTFEAYGTSNAQGTPGTLDTINMEVSSTSNSSTTGRATLAPVTAGDIFDFTSNNTEITKFELYNGALLIATVTPGTAITLVNGGDIEINSLALDLNDAV